MTTYQDRIPAILERVDLVELVTSFSGPPVAQTSGVLTFHCPAPDHKDEHPSFTVKDKQWRCWSQCASSGNAIDLMMLVGAADSPADAIDQLAGRVGLEKPQRTLRGTRSQRRVDPDVAAEVLDRYLRERHWPSALIAELGLCVVADQGGNLRVRHPFRLQGKTVGWQARAVDEGVEPRWLSSRGPIRCPYEADRLHGVPDGGLVVITEGVSDAASIIAAFPDEPVVGIPGTCGFKAQWVKAFEDLHVVVLGDNDAAGDQFRNEVAGLLNTVATMYQVPVPSHFGDVTDWLAGSDDHEDFADQVAAAYALTRPFTHG